MCGLLLRAVALSVFFFFLLDATSSIHIVTLGGQILGSTIVAVAAALLHTVSKKILSKKSLRIAFATFWTAIIAYLTIRLLPGYIVSDFPGATLVLLQVCLASAVVGMLIKDK
ncbi:MAG: hypothetical protein EOL98_02895 [Negativicutes bacterium]|nr:hypothetical protein [Negativicutes bacterium]